MDSKSKSCVDQVLWMETFGYRPGPLWVAAESSAQFSSCTLQRPRLEFQAFQSAVLTALDPHISSATKSSSTSKSTLCYISRQGRTSDRRLRDDDKFQSDMGNWASKAGNGSALVQAEMLKTEVREQLQSVAHASGYQFKTLLFGASNSWPPSFRAPSFEQVVAIKQCDVMFGVHGAGLMHEFWIAPSKPLLLVEVSNQESCRGYYGNIAYLLDHGYVCFNSVKNSNVTISGGQVLSFNTKPLIQLIVEHTKRTR